MKSDFGGEKFIEQAVASLENSVKIELSTNNGLLYTELDRAES